MEVLLISWELLQEISQISLKEPFKLGVVAIPKVIAYRKWTRSSKLVSSGSPGPPKTLSEKIENKGLVKWLHCQSVYCGSMTNQVRHSSVCL